MASVNDLKIRIQAALEGKTTFKETSTLLKDIANKLKETKQSSSNFNLLAKEFEKMNNILKTQKQAIDEIVNKEKTLDQVRRESARQKDSADKKAEIENKKRLSEIKALEQAERKLLDQNKKQEGKAFEQALREDKKRTQAINDENTRKQIDNINRIAVKQKEFEASVNRSAIQRLNQATNNNLGQQKSDAGFTGQSVTLGSQQSITQMKQYLNTLSPLDPAYAKVTARIKEYQLAQDKARGSSHLLTKEHVNLLAGLTAIGVGISQVAMRMKVDIIEGFKGEALLQNFKGTSEELDKIKRSAAGLIEDNKLLAVTNWASSLNNSIDQQSKLWQGARVIAQKTGQDIEGVFRGLVKSEEGMTKGLIAAGISRTRYNEVVAQSVQALGGETEETKDSNGVKDISIKKLDSETQSRIRQEAMIKVLTEKYGDLNGVQTTNFEKTQQLTVSIKDSREEIGLMVGTGLLKLTQALFGTGEESVKTAGKIGAIGGTLKDLMPIVIGLKVAFPALGTTIATAFTTAAGPVALFASSIGLLVAQVQSALSILQGGNVWDAISNNWIGKLTKKVAGIEDNPLDIDNSGFSDDSWQDEKMQKKIRDENLKKEDQKKKDEAKVKNLLDGNKTKSSGTPKQQAEEVVKVLNTEAQILQEIADLESKIAIETLPLQTREFKKQVELLKEKIKYLRGDFEKTDFSGFQSKTIQDDPIKKRTGGQMDLPKMKESISLLTAQLMGLGALEGVMNGLSNSVGGLFASFVPPQGAETPLKTFLKSVVVSMITAVQGAILAAKGFALASSIFSFGLSLLKDAPLLALALVALEGAKGIVGALAKGTNDWSGGTALVGEQGPELVNLPRHAQVFPHKETMNILNANISSKASSVKNEQYFRLDMNKGEFYEESRNEFMRYKKAIR